MPCSTRLSLKSVSGGAAPALNARTSRCDSHEAHASNPPSLNHTHSACPSAGVMRGAWLQTQHQRRSCDGSASGTGSFEKARTNIRLATS